jgi:ankyrin repeat protein
MRKRLICIVGVVMLRFTAVAAEDASDRFYQAIRNDDLSTLRGLVNALTVNSRDQRESTPLMYAAAYGSVDAMKILIGAGADVNANNSFGATALMWCANDMLKVRLLIDKGANVNARSKQGRTPLMIASAGDGNSDVVKLLIYKGADLSVKDNSNSTALLEAVDANDNATIRLLIEKGADVNARNKSGDTALMIASSYGNVEIMRTLLTKGADVNAVSAAETNHVKNGAIALGNFTALGYCVSYGGKEAVKILLDAGAKVNVQDVRGMTPLMLAIGTDRSDPEVIRLLLAGGADVSIKSKTGESAIDWAKKFNYPPVMSALGMERRAATPTTLSLSGNQKAAEPKEAAQKGIDLLQRTGRGFFKEGGCASCHAQNLSGLAISMARHKGLRVDEGAAAEEQKESRLQLIAFEQALLQRADLPGSVDGVVYALLQMRAGNLAPDRITDVLVHNMVGQQRRDGSWHGVGIARPPMEDGDFSRTALAIRSLNSYPIPARKAEFDRRIQRAAAWLKSASPRSTEDRSMQLLGMKWSGMDVGLLQDPLEKLIALERPDGGWAQAPDLESDAYATGMALYTMHELGVPAGAETYRRGVAYLVQTQLPDGSWHVVSRSPQFQPYFQSGFPHAHDQWISSAGTAWAVIGLTYAIGGEPRLGHRLNKEFAFKS